MFGCGLAQVEEGGAVGNEGEKPGLVGGWVRDDEREIREEEGRATKRGERGEMK